MARLCERCSEATWLRFGTWIFNLRFRARAPTSLFPHEVKIVPLPKIFLCMKYETEMQCDQLRVWRGASSAEADSKALKK